MQNQNSDIKVSVCIVSYNQEKYIGECLESLVTQKTNFPFEIIIGDDASSDNTPQIILDYQKKYPEIIQPVLRTKNLGPVKNTIDIYKRAKGKYIAHLDGDDMALPGKLQIQADILDANLDCSICVHNMLAIDADSKSTKKAFGSFEEKKYTLLDLYLINPFIIHSSKMFINKIEGYIDNLHDSALDLEVHIEQAKQGDIYFIKKDLGCYRQFVGITYEQKLINPIIPERINSIYSNIPPNFFTETEISDIKNRYAYILLQYANHYILNKEYITAKKFIALSGFVKKSLNYYIFSTGVLFPKIFMHILKRRKL